MGKNQGKNPRVIFMLNKLVADALEEASEVPPEILEFYMGQAAATLLWAATGQTVPSMPLPDDFPVQRQERALTAVPGDDAS